MLAVGPMVAMHYAPITQVAYLLLGVSILNLVATSANPVNQVLLSKLSMQIAEGRQNEARTQVGYLLTATTEVSIYISAQLVIFGDVVLRVVMGPQFTERGLLIRLLFAAIPFYLLYTALRSSIDAADIKANNARNITIALAVFLVLLAAAVSIGSAKFLELIALSLLGAMSVLAVLTVRSAIQLYDLKIEVWRSIPVWAVTAVLAALGLFLSVNLLVDSVLGVAIFQLGAAGVFAFTLRKTRAPWFSFLCRNLIKPVELPAH
jgi:O-antigen/teichoic acid export membrane protein